VALEKGLIDDKRESATMYVDDLAEFARVLLATTQMSFEIGWLRIQLPTRGGCAARYGRRPKKAPSWHFSGSRRYPLPSVDVVGRR
jgi:hypothetical protein